MLGNVGAFFVQVFNWSKTILTLIADNPLLLILVVGVPVCGFVIGWLSRLIRVN